VHAGRIAVVLAIVGHVASAEPAPRFAGASPKAGWQEWEIDDDGAAVRVHLLRDDRRLPLVVFAAGSHCVPVFFTSHGRDKSTLPFDVAAARQRVAFHFAVVERKGMAPFTDIPDIGGYDRCTEQHGSVRKQERAHELAAAARAFRDQPWVSTVLIAGHSEGADVAAGAVPLLASDGVSAVGFFASGGVSQFFDEVMEGRRVGDAARAQARFDELLAMTSSSPPADYEGAPTERFIAYAIDSTRWTIWRASRCPCSSPRGRAITTPRPSRPTRSLSSFCAAIASAPSTTSSSTASITASSTPVEPAMPRTCSPSSSSGPRAAGRRAG
jgi:hypothetical protein